MKKAELFHPRVFHDREWAEGYYKRNRWSIRMTGKRLADFLKKSGFTRGKILDAGCGFSGVPIEIAKVLPDVEITGIDLSKPLLEISHSMIEAEGFQNRIKTQEGDVQDLPFGTNSFDAVVNSYMLHIVEDPIAMLNEIERITKPGGKILITDLRRGFFALFVKKFKTSYTPEEALEIVRKSKIRPGKTGTGPFWWDYTVLQ